MSELLSERRFLGHGVSDRRGKPREGAYLC